MLFKNGIKSLLAVMVGMAVGILPLTMEGAGENPKSAGPSVLLLVEGQQRIDFNYLKALHRRGFQMDYCGSDVWAKEVANGTLLERLRDYHVVVMIQAGATGSESFFSRENMQTLVRTLAKYAEEGGGVFLMPNPILWDMDWNYPEFAKLCRETFGAAYVTSERILDSNPDHNAVGGMPANPAHLYIWTDNVAKHEVTKGVNGVWFSADVLRNERFTTIPLDIRDEPAWTVVLKGNKTAKSLSDADWRKQMNITEVVSTFTSKAEVGRLYDSEPPLMAVRTFGKGRVAYLPMDDITIWCAGYRHVHGGGYHDDSPGCALGGTLKGRTSNLEVLIDNTLKWLASPSIAAGNKPGGYEQDLSRLAPYQPPRQPPLNWNSLKFQSELAPEVALQGDNLNEIKRIAAAHGMGDNYAFWKDALQWGTKPFTGLIGARSTLSDGKSSVEKMAAAARKSGLNFLVFLERFDLLTPEKLEQLKAECVKASNDKLLVLPGYTIDDNRNHSLYVFGPKLEWPKEYLTEDGKSFNMAATEKTSGLTKMIDFMLSKIQFVNDMGYYNFTVKAPEGQVRGPMYDLRLYSSVGLYYYDGGKLVEGPEQNLEAFKDVNNLALCIKPYSIDIVRDAGELEQAVGAHALTRVIAKEVKDIANVLAYGFRALEFSVSVSPKSGPEVRRWTCENRDYACMPLREWVTPNYRWRVECSLSSEDGLDTVEIWDGVDLGARIKINGEQKFHQIFELSHRQMQQLMLVVKDVKGQTAFSGAVQDGNHTAQHYFCGDRINGGLFHGPYGDPRMTWGNQAGHKFKTDGYDGYDGLAAELQFHWWWPELDLGFKETKNHGFGGAHCYVYLCDEDAHVFSTTSDYSYPLDEKIIHAWYTYGPLVEREGTGTVGYRLEGCGGMVKQENFVTMKRDGKINYFPSTFLDYRLMGIIPGNTTVFTCAAGPNETVLSFNIPAEKDKLARLIDSGYTIGKGGFVACHGTSLGSGACVIYVLDDYKRKLVKTDKAPSFVALETIPAGTEYKKGERLSAKTLLLGGNAAVMGRIEAPETNGGWWYRKVADWLGLDGKPDIKVRFKAGQPMPPLEGFCDVDIAKDGYADMTFAPDGEAPLRELGVRLRNANDRWSMMRYQPKLPSVNSVETWFLRYVLPLKREVPDGLKPLGSRDNIGYVKVELPKPEDEPLQILAGHPVTASDPRVFIQVTTLSWKPYTYAVTVNNPTDEKLTVTLKPGLPLPDFPFKPRTITFKAGELRTVGIEKENGTTPSPGDKQTSEIR